jgi:protein-S-isoprenylcysteine O-methyltransferase Ste14
MTSSAAPSPPFLVRLGSFFFKYRNGLFPVVFLGLALLDRHHLAGGSWRTDHLVDAIGILIALAGQLLRAVTIGFAYIRRGGLQKKVYADRLVQEGMFAHSRNPLYVGNFLGLLGFMIVYHGPWVYAIGIPFFALAYRAIVAAEEDFLGRKFGAEFAAYCRRVPRFLPRFSGLRRSLAAMKFDWRRVVRKEYGSTMSGATLLALLFVWEHWAIDGRESGLAALRAAAPVWGLFALYYVVAFVLKKSGRLGVGSRETPAPEASPS